VPQSAALPASPGVQWASDWTSARATAQRDHKAIMVDLSTDWCTWCKELDAKVFPDARVGAASAQFVPVRMDGEHNGAAIVSHFAVTAYPTVLFIDADGTLVGEINGFAPADEYAKEINLIAKDYHDYPGLVNSVHQNPRDFGAATRVAKIDIDRQKPQDALTLADSMTSHGGGAEAAPVYNAVATDDYHAQNVDDAIALFRKSLKIAQSTKDLVAAHIGLVQCYATKDDMAGANQHLRAILALPGVPPNIKASVAKILTDVHKAGADGGQ